MLKDTGIPPYAILRKNVCEGASVFKIRRPRDNTSPMDSLPYLYCKYRKDFLI